MRSAPYLKLRTSLVGVFVAFVGAVLPTASTDAVPVLQLYIEGATYNSVTETWELTRAPGDPLMVWAIGNVDGPGGKGEILDVRMSFAYDGAVGEGAVDISLTPSTTGGFGGVTDPSTPSMPNDPLIEHTSGQPLLSDGKPLPSHEESGSGKVFGEGTFWQEFLLGDFALTDSPIADFIGIFPTALIPQSAQINVYEVAVAGLLAGSWLHIDLYDSVEGKGHIRTVFANNAHDAGNTVLVSEPANWAIFSFGLAGIGFFIWRPRKWA